MAYWIFKVNPDDYAIDQRLADPNPEICWLVSRYRDEVRSGDTVFLWKCGKNRGIRAVIRVDAEPRQMHELETEQPYWRERDTDIEWRVMGTLTHRDVDLRADSLKKVPGLRGLSTFHGWQQATNFRVTPAEGAILLRLLR